MCRPGQGCTGLSILSRFDSNMRVFAGSPEDSLLSILSRFDSNSSQEVYNQFNFIFQSYQGSILILSSDYPHKKNNNFQSYQGSILIMNVPFELAHIVFFQSYQGSILMRSRERKEPRERLSILSRFDSNESRLAQL